MWLDEYLISICTSINRDGIFSNDSRISEVLHFPTFKSMSLLHGIENGRNYYPFGYVVAIGLE